MEQNLFKVGCAYRTLGGGVAVIQHFDGEFLTGHTKGEPAGSQVWRTSGSYWAGIRRSDEMSLTAGELHQVDGQWVPVEGKKARYHGFTCPECGSHYFGTSNWHGVLTGHCHGDQHTGSGCGFTWDRTDKAEEARCMYEQTLEEWAASYVAPDLNAEMLRKDAKGFAAAKPFVKPEIAQKLVQGPHAPIDGLTSCKNLGVRVLGSRGG